MRFLVDESTGQAVTAYLRRAGHDVMFVIVTERHIRFRSALPHP
jgi:hypothetical protein